MRYKIGICDDDAGQRAYLAEIAADWAKEAHCPIKVKQYSDARAFPLSGMYVEFTHRTG